jgi:hypothetical protein
MSFNNKGNVCAVFDQVEFIEFAIAIEGSNFRRFSILKTTHFLRIENILQYKFILSQAQDSNHKIMRLSFLVGDVGLLLQNT